MAKYQVESSAVLSADMRLQSDPKLVKRLARSLVLVLKELGDDCQRLQANSNTLQATVDRLRNGEVDNLGRLDLLGVVRAIEAAFPDRIIQQSGSSPNDANKVALARPLCLEAARRTRAEIVDDDALIGRVFGADQITAARAVLKLAADNLDKLGRGDEGWDLVYDNTLAAQNMSATGSVKKITFSDALLKAGSAPLTLLLHEATHTIENNAQMTRDHLYRNHLGFVSAPADIKLKNAAHYEELGWQAFENAEQRAFVPEKDVRAVVVMVVTNAWIMSGWLLDYMKTSGSGFKQNGSRILGLTLHKKAAPDAGYFGSALASIGSLFSGPHNPALSAVDATTARQHQTTLSNCMAALKEGALDDFVANGTTPTAVVDASLLHLMTREDLRLRKTAEKSVLMIKALAALYLLRVDHFKAEPGDTSTSNHKTGPMSYYDPAQPSAKMAHFASLLDGHVQRISNL